MAQGPDTDLARFPAHETAIHPIDTFRYLMGEVAAVTADPRRINPAIAGADAGLIPFTLANGARGLFDGNRLADLAADNRRLATGEMTVEGSRGTLGPDGFGAVRFEQPAGCRL